MTPSPSNYPESTGEDNTRKEDLLLEKPSKSLLANQLEQHNDEKHKQQPLPKPAKCSDSIPPTGLARHITHALNPFSKPHITVNNLASVPVIVIVSTSPKICQPKPGAHGKASGDAIEMEFEQDLDRQRIAMQPGSSSKLYFQGDTSYLTLLSTYSTSKQVYEIYRDNRMLTNLQKYEITDSTLATVVGYCKQA